MGDYATNVLQLAGNFTGNLATVSGSLSQEIHLLELRKDRNKAAGAATIGGGAFYIQVTCDINAHVSHIQNNTPNNGSDDLDDAFSLSAMEMKSTHFSDTYNDAGSNYLGFDPAEGSADVAALENNQAWRKNKTVGGVTTANGNGSSVKYKLPTNTASNLKLGHIKFASSYFKVQVNIGVEEAHKNEYTVSNPDVVAAGTGSSLTETTAENLQVAQYLYVSKTEVNDADANGIYTDNAAIADRVGQTETANQEEGALKSIYGTDGAANSWAKTTGGDIDSLEDLLSVTVTQDEVEAAYATDLAALKSALQGGDANPKSKVITSWTITVNEVAASKDSLLTKFGRNKNVATGVTAIFAQGDKIVIVDENLNNKKVELELAIQEQKTNSAENLPGGTTKIIPTQQQANANGKAEIFALVCQN